MMNNLDVYFSGKQLYGDDFTQGEIEQWYEDEQEAYTDLYIRPSIQNYHYKYRYLDIFHAWRFISHRYFKRALGIGSAMGDEFIPLIKLGAIETINIIEPSSLYREFDNIEGVPTQWREPKVTGDIDFENESFNLITCLSVLHHIPNVTHVMNECARVLAHGGMLILREPIISMGDWRRHRSGLTKRERGIPKSLLTQNLLNAGLKIIHKSLYEFPVVAKLSILGIEPYNVRFTTRLDATLSKLLEWNYRYHRINLFQKLAPRGMYFVAFKE